jgi:hypothetical protein
MSDEEDFTLEFNTITTTTSNTTLLSLTSTASGVIKKYHEPIW